MDSWLAGFATTDEIDRFRRQHYIEQWRWDRDVLVIIDYAASRADQIRQWIKELGDVPFKERRKSFRLLLLERQVHREHGWFVQIFGHGTNDNSRASIALLDSRDVVNLQPLDKLEHKRKIFTVMLRRYDRDTELNSEHDAIFNDSKWEGDPLYLMVAGAVAGKRGYSNALQLSHLQLIFSIAQDELDRIGKIGVGRGIDAIGHDYPGWFLRHMAVMTTLAQGLTLKEARSLAKNELTVVDFNATLELTIQALMDALPGEEGNKLSSIQPDIIGEAAILLWFGVLEAQGLSSEERIDAVARTKLSTVSETLARAAQDFTQFGREEPVRWLRWLANRPDNSLATIIQICMVLSDQTAGIKALADQLYKRIDEDLPGSVPIKSARGHRIDAFAIKVSSSIVEISALKSNSFMIFDDYMKSSGGIGMFTLGTNLDQDFIDLKISANEHGTMVISIDEKLPNFSSRLADNPNALSEVQDK